MFVLRCAFGGANEAFVLCGSEDATVSIWNKEKGDIIAKIGTNSTGHSQVINCVSWSPADPYVFATASDDQTVRIWGIEGSQPWEVLADPKDLKRSGSANGTHTDMQLESDDDYDDEEDEEEEEEEYRPQILQATRVVAIPEEEDEDEEQWGQ